MVDPTDIKDDTCVNEKSPCEGCENLKEEITKIMNILTDIQSSQDKERQNSSSRAEESDAKIKYLLEDKNKMATKIESLEATIAELTKDNNGIKQVLDLKQNEYGSKWKQK